MLNISQEAKDAIRSGNMEMLKKVLEDECEMFRIKLLNEKNEFKFVQGAAYYAEALRSHFV